MRDQLAQSLETATFDGNMWRDSGAWPGSIAYPQSSAVPRDIRVYGYVYNVANGKLIEAAKAMEIGMAEDRRRMMRAA